MKFVFHRLLKKFITLKNVLNNNKNHINYSNTEETKFICTQKAFLTKLRPS